MSLGGSGVRVVDLGQAGEVVALRATEGGLRYAISFATQGPKVPEFAGLAEVYYTNAAASRAHQEKIGPDSFLNFAEGAGIFVGREVVGVP